MSISSEKLRQKLYMQRYLEELSALAGYPVQATELGSLAQAASIRDASQKFNAQSSRSTEIPFADKCSERFKKFIQMLYSANASSIYIWTPRTINCGTFLASSIEAVKFGFDFTVNQEGVLVFESSDLQDRLLLDFFVSPADEQMLKIEVQGLNWGDVVY